MQLVQIIYTSTLRSTEQGQIDSILEASRIRNLKNAVTGMLFRAGAKVIQVIEGPDSTVDKVYAKIASDSRHFNLTFVGRKLIAKREFLEWDLGYTVVTPEMLDASFAKYAMFETGPHFFKDQVSHQIACEVLQNLKTNAKGFV